jgi:hypothetical protein
MNLYLQGRGLGAELPQVLLQGPGHPIRAVRHGHVLCRQPERRPAALPQRHHV